MGSRHGKSHMKTKVSINSIDAKSELTDLENKATNTTSLLIKELVFDCISGVYKEGLVCALRELLEGFDPGESDIDLIRVLLTLDNGDRLANYINRYTVYHVGIGIKDIIFEYGEYPSTELTESAEVTESTETKKKPRDKYNAKPLKARRGNKKPRDSVVASNKKLKNSYLIGFKERYGGRNGMSSPESVTFGRKSLANAAHQLCAEYHVPQKGKVNDICYNWRAPLVTITVSLCEAARFHPVCWYINKMFVENENKKLLDWLFFIMTNWKSMSRIFRRIDGSVSYATDIPIPTGFDDLTLDKVKGLYKDLEWVKLVLAIVCRLEIEEP